MNEIYDSMHDWYLENQLLASHLPIGVQLEIIGTAYELETGQISRTEALTMAVYYAAVQTAHLWAGIVAVEQMQRAYGLYYNVHYGLARKIQGIAFGRTLRLATTLMKPLLYLEVAKLGMKLFSPGATSYTRVHYGDVRSFHAMPRLYL